MNDIPFTKYIFNVDTMGHISIRNITTGEICDFDAHFENLGIFNISFSFTDKSYAIQFVRYLHNGDNLRVTATFSFLGADYSFVLVPRMDDVSLTPDSQFRLKLSGDIIEPSELDLDSDEQQQIFDEDTADELRLVSESYETDTDESVDSLHLSGRNELLDIMLILSLRDIFVGYVGKVIPCDKFESRILNRLDTDQQKFVLSVYHKDYKHNEYRMFEDASWSDRMRFLWIVCMLADMPMFDS